MKTARRYLLGLLAGSCFFAGGLTHHAIFGTEDASQGSSGSAEQDQHAVCKRVIRPTLVMPNSPVWQEQNEEASLSIREAEELLRKALETPNFRLRSTLLSDVAWKIQDDDIRQALAWAERIPRGVDRDQYRWNLVRRWAGYDSAGALDYAMGLRKGLERTEAASTVLSEWFAHETEAALAWTLDQAPSHVRNQGIQMGIRKMISHDPLRAIELTKELKPDQANMELSSIFFEWSSQDPGLAAAASLELEDESSRSYAMQSVVSVWAERDIEATMDWIRSLPPGSQNDQLKASAIVMHGHTQTNPISAIEMALAEGSDEAAKSLLWSHPNQIADNTEEFTAFFEWAQALPDSEIKDTAMTSLGGALASRQPQKAIEWAAGIPSKRIRDFVADRAVIEWAQTDGQAAAAYVDQLPDGKQRRTAMENLIGGWTVSRPEQAADYLERSVGGGDPGNSLGILMSNWSYHDPQAAADWVTETKLEPSASSVQTLVSGWQSRDENLDGAAAWADALPPGKLRDSAMLALSNTVAWENKQEAWNWAENIEDDTARTEAITLLASTWLATDQEVARSWIEQAGIPDELRNQLLDPDSVPSPNCICQ